MFFSLDGVDGVGKTTQLELFCDWLRSLGHTVCFCRDPGSTPLGEEIRKLLLEQREGRSIARRSEMLLYMAARAQLVDEVIAPALAAGEVVVSDRYLLANVVYQGHAGGLDVATLWQVGEVATAGVAPDLTILLDMPLEVAAERMNRPLDRMELQGDEFRQRLRFGFLHEARQQPDRIVVIDAARSIDEVQADIRAAAARAADPPVAIVGYRANVHLGHCIIAVARPVRRPTRWLRMRLFRLFAAFLKKL